ncbi:MAG: EAL domain-containing protein [Spirochaetaceae bacterium]|nr:EAL domain-containing protein [Spirochaetaceae bacterium]
MHQTEFNIIFTNDNCIGCNRCISGCPIPGANVASFSKGQNKIIVDNERCIHCGHCITICTHNAREYKDDTDSFFEDLSSGVPMSVIVAPSFYVDYPDLAFKILGYLKSIGVKKIWNASFGADISTWAYVHYLGQNPNKSGITQPCAAVVNYIEKQRPELIPNLLPIQSPLICLATYVKKYLGHTENLAFISPCIAKKDEISSPETHGLVQHNLTFAHLLKKLEGIDLQNYYAEAEPLEEGLGALYPISGGLKENLEYFLGHQKVILQLSDLKHIGYDSESVADIISKGKEPIILDLLQCQHGCVFGTGVDKEKCSMECSMLEYAKLRKNCADLPNEDSLYSHEMPRTQRIPMLNQRFKQLNPLHFMRGYHSQAKPVKLPTEQVFQEIFAKMYKTTPESQKINCQACGYSSCRQMAESIANGYNTIENCVYYEKAENLRLCSSDVITGLPNNYMMINKGEELFNNKVIQEYSLIQFNIKNFMLFNNRFGYDGANSILKAFAEEAEKKLLSQEYLFHIGADTFVAFVLQTNLETYIYKINNITLALLDGNLDMQNHLSVRCGVYQPTGKETSFSEITKYLFSTFLLSKQDKKNDVVFFDKNISELLISQIILTQQIPKALEKEEFFVMYQPKVRLCDNTLYGAEALIRWERNGEVILPGKFIPICESNGLVCDLDFFVLNSVCKSINSWIKAGLEPVKISVNLSKLHFNQEDIADKICAVVDKWQVPHHLIELEFTETVYADAQQVLNETMHRLKHREFSASIDDFGSGYSSLSLLQNLDFDVLKIDKSLIDTIEPDSQAKTVVTNIIKMAKELNMDVVAEGVETAETVHLLQELKCDIIQGYIFDKPLSEEEFIKRLKRRQYDSV